MCHIRGKFKSSDHKSIMWMKVNIMITEIRTFFPFKCSVDIVFFTNPFNLFNHCIRDYLVIDRFTIEKDVNSVRTKITIASNIKDFFFKINKRPSGVDQYFMTIFLCSMDCCDCRFWNQTLFFAVQSRINIQKDYFVVFTHIIIPHLNIYKN